MNVFRALRMYHMMTAVGVYLLLISAFWIIQPRIAFFDDGSIKPFGAHGRNSTLFPVWWWCLVLAVAAYFIMVYMRIFY